MAPKLFKCNAASAVFGTEVGHNVIQFYNLDYAMDDFDLGSYDEN